MKIFFKSVLVGMVLGLSLFSCVKANDDIVNIIKQNNLVAFGKILPQIDSENINNFISEDEMTESYNKFTLLGLASAYKQVDMIMKLLEGGADINLGMADDYYIYDALYSLYQKASDNTNNKKVVMLLLKYGANVNSFYGDNARSILHIACSKNDHEVVELLLENGADPNNAGEIGIEYHYYPLIEAVRNNNLVITKLLLGYKADVDVKDENNKTALDYAKSNNNNELIELLSKHH